MANELRTEVEQVKEREDVKRALKQASPHNPTINLRLKQKTNFGSARTSSF